MLKNKLEKIRLLQAFKEGHIGVEKLVNRMDSVPTWVAAQYETEEEIAKHYEHLYGTVKVVKIGDKFYLVNPKRIHQGIYWFENEPIPKMNGGDPRENFPE